MKATKSFILKLCLLFLVQLPFGTFDCLAQDVASFQVNPLTPKITSPKENTQVQSSITIEGEGGKNQEIEVNVLAIFTGGEHDLGTFGVKADGNGKWKTHTVSLYLPEGVENAKYVITAVDNKTGRTSKAITVLPPKTVQLIQRAQLGEIKMLEKPLRPTTISSTVLDGLNLLPAPNITEPKNGAQVDSMLRLKGKGLQNVMIEFSIIAKSDTNEEHDLGFYRVKTDPNGDWESSQIRLWTPFETNDIKYQIEAVQFDEDSGESKKRRITLHSKKQARLNTTATIAQPRSIDKNKINRKLSPKDATAFEAPSKPLQISPQPGEVISHGPIQFLGTGTAGNKVVTSVSYRYFVNGRVEINSSILTSNVDQSGVWRTPIKDFGIPDNAYDIQYSVTNHQVTAKNKKSEMEALSFKQKLKNPEIGSTSHYHETSTGTGTVIRSLGWKEPYKDEVTVKGKGGAGLHILVELRIIRDNVEVGGRYGTVRVNSKGKWEWKGGWKKSGNPDYKFIVRATQVSPGNYDDKSDVITKNFK